MVRIKWKIYFNMLCLLLTLTFGLNKEEKICAESLDFMGMKMKFRF